MEFLGFLPYEKTEEYFDKAELLVNTSATEGFPNTFLQAWSRGVPTIAYVDSGARVNGRPVGRKVESQKAMVNTVAELVRDQVVREEEGEFCRNYFEKNHSTSQILDFYEEIFACLWAGSGIPPIRMSEKELGGYRG
jgi:glycosyltransferase involved in cell wall biosynthesis